MRYIFVLAWVIISTISWAQVDSVKNLREEGKDSVKREISTNTVKDTKFDTIFVSDRTRNTVIMLDEGVTAFALTIGTKDYFGQIEHGNSILLRAAVANPTTVASLFFRYGDKFYRGRLAFNPALPEEDEVVDMRSVKEEETLKVPEPDPFSEQRVADKVRVERKLGILEGKEKDRFFRMATIGEKLTFKIADIMQDDTYLYIKLGIYNEAKEVYNIEYVDFLYKHKDDSKQYHQVQRTDVITNGLESIKAKSSGNLICAFPKFALTSDWFLRVKLKQKNGARDIEVIAPYKEVFEAIKIQ